MAEALRIGRAAAATGLSIETIRFYEKRGLLSPPARSRSGYRLSTGTDLEELQFVGKAQELGFSLTEIKERVLLRNRNARVCPNVRDLLKRKLAERHKLGILQRLEAELDRALRRCNRALLRKHVESSSCPVIDDFQRSTARRVP